jgi:hypothetical protein
MRSRFPSYFLHGLAKLTRGVGSIKEVLEEARGDDIEDYGKMILTTLMGIDETKGWLHSRGGAL